MEKRSYEKNNGEKTQKYSLLLILLSWLVYTCSYIGKLGYTANIIQIEKVFNVSHADSGMVTTFFFFAYGAGQIINGICCKRYNLRVVVFGGLVLSGICNFLIGVITNFTYIKYVWVINGGALSVLWTGLIRLLSETIDKKQMPKAVMIMGTTVAIGTFLVYGLSSLLVALKVFKVIFFLAGILLPTVAIIWFFVSPFLVEKVKSFNEKEEEEEIIETAVTVNKNKGIKEILGLFSIFAFYAVMNNLIKDGLTTWVPVVLNKNYNLPDYMSILLTLMLPLCAVFGVFVVVNVNKKIKNFVSLCMVLFAVTGALIGVVIGVFKTDAFVVVIISFALIACFMAGVNNVITSMIPLYWKDKVNSGMVSGILNGFCYLGSTISSYGLGLIADLKGWNAVFWLLLFLCVVAVSLGTVEKIIRRIKR